MEKEKLIAEIKRIIDNYHEAELTIAPDKKGGIMEWEFTEYNKWGFICPFYSRVSDAFCSYEKFGKLIDEAKERKAEIEITDMGLHWRYREYATEVKRKMLSQLRQDVIHGVEYNKQNYGKDEITKEQVFSYVSYWEQKLTESLNLEEEGK